MPKLFGHPVSIHSRKAHFALAELGQEHTYQLVDLLKGEHHSPQFRAVNPSGKVPVLQGRRPPAARVRRHPALPRRELRRRQAPAGRQASASPRRSVAVLAGE